MSGVINPLPNLPSWRGAQLKKSTVTTLPLTLHLNGIGDKFASGHKNFSSDFNLYSFC